MNETTKEKIRLALLGKKFSKQRRINISKALTGKTHSAQHKENYKKSIIKNGHGFAWNGGEHRKDGYVYVWSPHHPNARQNGYIKKSRLVMSDYLGRPLLKTEVVHHKNNIKDDDRVNNLEIFCSNGLHITKTMVGHKHTPRKYLRINDGLPDINMKIEGFVKNRKTYIKAICIICKNQFWTRDRKERPTTKTCSKACFIEEMKNVRISKQNI